MIIRMVAVPEGKPGKVGKIHVKVGDRVAADDVIAEVETGKGNRPIKAAAAGIVSRILCEEGAEIASKAEMFEIKEIEEIEEVGETGSLHAPQEAEKISPTQRISKEIATDLLIIGAGPGGYVAAVYAAKNGLKVTLVEKAKLGGTCLNVGCIPTKALVKSAEVFHEMRNAALFGLRLDGEAAVDMRQVIDHKDQIKDRLVAGIDFLMKKNDIAVLSGTASFVDGNTVAVSGDESYIVKAKDIIVATGSKISKIPIPGIDLPFVLNSTSALSAVDLPASIVIVGGGVIGMEFAFMYRHFGIDVHVIEFMDCLLPMVDGDISQEIEDIAKAEGIDVHTGSKVVKIQSSLDGKAVIAFENQDGAHLLVSDKVLVAIGREPNLEGLAIENSGVLLNENGRGIRVDASLRTNIDHIYAIGDVTDIMQLAHVASHQGLVAVDHILNKPHGMDYAAVPNVIFTAPEIATVGIGEDEAKAKGMNIAVSKFSFAGNGKALTMEAPRGFIKLVKDNETGKIIGGAIIGADASSLISALTLAIANGLTEKEIAATIFPHPTTGEVIHEAALGFGIGALHQ